MIANATKNIRADFSVAQGARAWCFGGARRVGLMFWLARLVADGFISLASKMFHVKHLEF